MKFLKKEALVIVSCILLAGLGAFGLSFLMPTLSVQSLLVISGILLVLLYFLFKVGSFIIKIILVLLIIGTFFYFLH